MRTSRARKALTGMMLRTRPPVDGLLGLAGARGARDPPGHRRPRRDALGKGRRILAPVAYDSGALVEIGCPMRSSAGVGSRGWRTSIWALPLSARGTAAAATVRRACPISAPSRPGGHSTAPHRGSNAAAEGGEKARPTVSSAGRTASGLPASRPAPGRREAKKARPGSCSRGSRVPGARAPAGPLPSGHASAVLLDWPGSDIATAVRTTALRRIRTAGDRAQLPATSPTVGR
jgi:hypothetical protein